MKNLYTENEIVELIESENMSLLYEAIEEGLNLNQAFMGMNPLFWAAKNNSLPMIEFLLTNKVNLNLKGIYKGDTCNVLGVCIYEQNLALFHYFIDKDIEIKDYYKSKSILMHAVELGDKNLVEKILFKANAQINAKDLVYGDSALILAAKHKHEDILYLLLQQDKINIGRGSENVLRYNALHYYLEQSNPNVDLIKLFILSGANFQLNELAHLDTQVIIELQEMSYLLKEYGEGAKQMFIEKKQLEESIQYIDKKSTKDKKI